MSRPFERAGSGSEAFQAKPPPSLEERPLPVSKVGLSKKEIEAALKVTISNEIPSERCVPIAVNRGNPAVLAEPGSDYTKAIRELAKAVVRKDAPAQKGKRRSFSLARS